MKFENLKILFAEDEEELRETMIDILSFDVKELIVAKDGQEAYELYKQNRPDIMLLDINMPKMSGLELAKKIRETDHSTRIIMITAHSEVDILLEATQLHLSKYLLKPITGDELYNSLQIAVNEMKNFKVLNSNILNLKENFTWEFEELKLLKDLKEIHLTPKEKKILNIFFSNPNSTITYDRLIDEVWSDYDNYNIDTVKTMIKNIRKKLPENTIKNIYGIGFKYEN